LTSEWEGFSARFIKSSGGVMNQVISSAYAIRLREHPVAPKIGKRERI